MFTNTLTIPGQRSFPKMAELKGGQVFRFLQGNVAYIMQRFHDKTGGRKCIALHTGEVYTYTQREATAKEVAVIEEITIQYNGN